jgi:hypothetical protein
MKLNLFLLSAAALVNAATATDTVNLGTADDYVILTKTGISTVPTSAITGNIGVSPIAATAITGFGLILDSGGQFSLASQITGQAFAADYGGPTATALTVAVGDMEIAYADAFSRAPTTTYLETEPVDIGSTTLTTGVYSFSGDIKIGSSITFSGTSTDVFIVQTTGSLFQAADTRVNFSDGALAKNVFWQVAEKVKVGNTAHMAGVLLVKENVLFMTGSSLNGRVLAQWACDLQSTTVTAPAE